MIFQIKMKVTIDLFDFIEDLYQKNENILNLLSMHKILFIFFHFVSNDIFPSNNSISFTFEARANNYIGFRYLK